MSVALAGDTVLVLPGTYPGFVFGSEDIRVIGVGGPAQTQVDGGVAWNFNQATRASVLSGFTISDPDLGSAVLAVNDASPTIEGNVIVGNRSSFVGGCLYIGFGANPMVRDNVFCDNTSDEDGRGGAVYVEESAAVFQGNRFSGNIVDNLAVSGASGGAIYADCSSVTLRGNLFEGNAAMSVGINRGGAIYAELSTLVLEGNTFVGNLCPDLNFPPFSGPGEGAALYGEDSVITGKHNLFWGNLSDLGHEIFLDGGSLFMEYSNVQLALSGVGGPTAPTFGAGMLNVDPALDASFHLLPLSPLIDAGDPSTSAGGVDAQGDPRLLDGDADGILRVDIGWDEYNRACLDVLGTGALGSTLTITTSGLGSDAYWLFASFGTGDVRFQGFGSILLDAHDSILVGQGASGGSDSVMIPMETSFLGRCARFQALVSFPGGNRGSVTRRVDIALH